MNAVVIAGHGLHGGASVELRLLSEPGPVRLRARGVEARIDELVPDGAARSTTVTTADGRLRVRTVEHLFAALEALRVREGIVVALASLGDLDEVPLADGGAATFYDALVQLGAVQAPRTLTITRAATFSVGESEYELQPHPTVEIEVLVDFGDGRLAPGASWAGDAADFRSRIAAARTFGFERDLGDLLARGLASHVTPESVVVLGPERIHAAGAPFTADEPARHKLLDLIGDLHAHGGAPVGRLRARRPGHAATHAVMRRALDEGVVRAMIPAR